MEMVTSFLQKERVQNLVGFHSNKTAQELLEYLNLLQGEELTYAAVLCFGKNPAKWIAGAFTRCTAWKGNDRLEGWEEDQEFHGSLLEQYESAIEFLQRNLRLSRVISAQGSVEQWELPLMVLREALANALIHREYADQTNCVRIEIFDNRIEISSSGNLPDGLTIPQLGRKGTHYPPGRNPHIAHIFYLYNYVEGSGLGIARMQQAMKEAGLPEPQFDTNDERTFQVIVRRPQSVELPELTSSSLRGVESHQKTDHSISPRVKLFVIKRRYQLLSLLLAILLVIVFSILVFPRLFPSAPMGIGVINEPNNEQIGLSDGTYAFDTSPDRVDASLKVQAAAKFAQGDKSGAISLWNQAVGNDTSDAEALIYLEDQRVLASGSPYITLVVATALTGSQNDVSSGRDDLQGAYVQQKEYNDGRKLSGKLVRLLIANAGSKKDYVAEVAGQIVQAAKQDSTIVGVMGWPFSEYVQEEIPILAGAHIPIVSSTASADSLSKISPYFFRVAPPNKTQAIAGAKYAEQQLHASRVALFVDPSNAYSSNLADDFEKQFVADGNQIVDTENYTVGDQADLPALLPKALHSNPNLVYFAGYADDLAVLLVNFPTSQPDLQVLGGDGLYEPNAYPSSARPSFSRVHFTAFAYPDEWSLLGMNKPPFFSEYSQDFNPIGADHNGNPYGFTRADYSVILAYDALYALLRGCQNVLDAKIALIPIALQHGLTQITGAKAIQGVSGQISFDGNGDPIDKAVVILYVDQDGHIKMLQPDGVLGCFVVGRCG